MELRAVFEALRAVPPTQAVLIQTDSKYVISVFTEWIEGWAAKGWKTAGKKPVSNQENIRLIADLLHERDVEWRHVRGHRGHEMNEFVDRRAHDAATAQKLGNPVNKGPGLRELRGGAK